jgi:hypothetical protein
MLICSERNNTAEPERREAEYSSTMRGFGNIKYCGNQK